MIALTRKLADDGELLQLVDNLAFSVVRFRLSFTSGTEEWAAYLAFLNGYTNQTSFLKTNDVNQREDAVASYLSAIEFDGTYQLAHYNLANLLYNRYTQNDNADAAEHFKIASRSSDRKLKALALAGLTMTYAQNVHRFGLGARPWVRLADESSDEAARLGADLEETLFAQAWAHQIAGRVPQAIARYTDVMTLKGQTLSERQIKSFALNNKAYLIMNSLGDLDTAEALLRGSDDKNKMTYANIAEVCKRRGRYDEALEYLSKARALDARYVNAMNETGIVYLAKAREAKGDRDRVALMLTEADRWRRRALGAIPESARSQRISVQRAYDKALNDYGFPAVRSRVLIEQIWWSIERSRSVRRVVP